MSHIIFHKPPPIGAHVKIFHKSGQRAEPLLLLTFIGDDYTSGFTIPGHTFDASKITIIINDNILPTTEWTVSENRWQNNLKDPTMSKSVIQFQHEMVAINYDIDPVTYQAPIVLSAEDKVKYIYGVPQSLELFERIKKAIESKGYIFRQVGWTYMLVYYHKP